MKLPNNCNEVWSRKLKIASHVTQYQQTILVDVLKIIKYNATLLIFIVI